jgi:hypothetical protein
MELPASIEHLPSIEQPPSIEHLPGHTVQASVLHVLKDTPVETMERLEHLFL